MNCINAIDELYVNSENGNDLWDGTSPVWISDFKGPMKTVQKAIDTSNDKGTINVADGIYKENININKNISILGESTDKTIIDGKKENRVMNISRFTHVTIKNLTIQNGELKKESVHPEDVYGAGIFLKGLNWF